MDGVDGHPFAGAGALTGRGELLIRFKHLLTLPERRVWALGHSTGTLSDDDPAHSAIFKGVGA